jgi:predicted phosphodiesterase
MLEINTFDLHLGKLSWAEETGEDCDLKILSDRFTEAFDYLLGNSLVHPIDKILIPIGNDFFNSDNAYPTTTTTNGTYQHDDTRWQKIFRTGWNLYREQIDRCKEIAPVHIITVPGNHDYQKTFYLGEVLSALYASDDNVLVDDNPMARKYVQYGQTLLGFTHGNQKNESEKRLSMLMQQEAREQWANSRFAEWHLGDIHHEKVVKYVSTEDHGGLIVRYLRSLSPTDAWHYQKGFVGAQKGAEAYVFDIDNGRVATYYYNV